MALVMHCSKSNFMVLECVTLRALRNLGDLKWFELIQQKGSQTSLKNSSWSFCLHSGRERASTWNTWIFKLSFEELLHEIHLWKHLPSCYANVCMMLNTQLRLHREVCVLQSDTMHQLLLHLTSRMLQGHVTMVWLCAVHIWTWLAEFSIYLHVLTT